MDDVSNQKNEKRKADGEDMVKEYKKRKRNSKRRHRMRNIMKRKTHPETIDILMYSKRRKG